LSLLIADGLTKYYGGVCALYRISAELVSGEVLAIVGDNEGGTEPLEKVIGSFAGIASVETIDLNRMI
jgi:ABC-type phosphonate transport system ATPase subunit